MDRELSLVASGLPPGQICLFLVSDTPGFTPGPIGSQGDLCLEGSIGRYLADVATSNAQGAISLLPDLGQVPTPTSSVAVMAGQTWVWQAWYRDQNPAPTSEFTEALAVTFQ